MQRDEVVKALKESRTQMEAALAGLTETQMTDPGVVGDWSVKDVLSHLIAWEAELVTLLAKARQGKPPQPPARSQKDIDELNAKWYKENKNRPLDRVLADFHGVRKQTLRQVEALSDEEINAPRPWLRGEALLEWIEGDGFGHEAEHAAQIVEWRKMKLGE